MGKINIWMDCDPGIDDAVALAMAAASQDKLKLLGISTVAGNQTGDRVTENALRLREFLGLDHVPVVRGAEKPLIRELGIADDIHGNTGLGSCILPEAKRGECEENGLLFLRNTIMGLPAQEKVTLVPTGPMTNIALLLRTFPEVAERVEKIVFMGGSCVGGNVTAAAEFNFWVDPEAAQIVMCSGIPLVMCALDITMQCGLTHPQVDALLTSSNPVLHAYGEMLSFYFETTEDENPGMVSIHDAVTILYLTNERLFRGESAHVEVDCSEGIHRGAALCDRRGERGCQEKNVFLLNRVDLTGFQRVLLEKLDKVAKERT